MGRYSSAPAAAFADYVRDAGRAPFRNDHRARAGRVRRADDGAEIVRIFHAIEHDHELRRGGGVEIGVLAGRAHGNHALMRGTAGQPIQRSARLEPHRHRGAPRQVDDLLQARSAGALRHQDAVERMLRPQRFRYRMNAAENRHQASGSMFSPLLNRLVKLARPATSVISTICSLVKCSASSGARLFGVGRAGQLAGIANGGAFLFVEVLILLGLDPPQLFLGDAGLFRARGIRRDAKRALVSVSARDIDQRFHAALHRPAAHHGDVERYEILERLRAICHGAEERIRMFRLCFKLREKFVLQRIDQFHGNGHASMLA